MPDPDDDRFRELDEDEEEEPTTRSLPLPRSDLTGRMPTQLDSDAGEPPLFDDDDDEDEPTLRSLPQRTSPRERMPTSLDGRPRFADEDGDTAVDEVAVSLPDDD